MTKLANCLLRQAKDFKNFDESEVVEASKIYQSRGKSEDAANILAIEDHLRDLRTQRSEIAASVVAAFKAKDPAKYAEIEAANRPAAPKQADAEDIGKMFDDAVDEAFGAAPSERDAAMAELGQGIDELISLMGGKANMLPEEEARLIPIMSKIFRAAAKLGYLTFKDAGRFVLSEIRGKSREVADKLSIENLQAGYINIAKEIGGDKRAALDFDTIEQLMAADPDPHPEIEAAAHEAATSPLNDKPQPTEGQKEAGNYAKGHITIQGLDISIENPQGSVRSGVSPDGKKWENKLAHHYGYVRGTVGADKDHVDVFVTPGAEAAQMVWVIDQKNKDGSFDEHKIVLGPATESEARAAYLANYQAGWDGLGAISSLPMAAFRAWVKSAATKRPLSYVPSKAQAPQAATSAPQSGEFKAGDRIEWDVDGVVATGTVVSRMPDVGGSGLAPSYEVEIESHPTRNKYSRGAAPVASARRAGGDGETATAEDSTAVATKEPAASTGTLAGDETRLLERFPVGTRVRVSRDSLSQSEVIPLRDGVVTKGHFAGWYVKLDPTPRERTEKEVLILDSKSNTIERIETTQHENATAPEHVKDDTGVTVAELKQIAKAFRDAIDRGDDAEVTHIFDAPTKSEIVRLKTKADAEVAKSGWLTPAQAKERVQEWRDRAAAQYDNDETRSANSQKIVISLFDLTGKWSQPWEEAGYQVYRFDIQNGDQAEHNGETINLGDINNFSTDFFNDIFGSFDGLDVHAILAACPCTDFAVSGARHFAAKDADGRTVSSIKLVNTTLATIEYFKPSIWALENPVGRIEELTGLPPWRLSFDPNHLGDTYTKKTLIWGRFNADLPVAPVEPTEGSKMHSQYGGKSQATKNARSATPEGFAYGFFMANNAVDNPALAISGKYDRLDRSAIEAAVKAGVTAAQIDEAVEDFYYMDLDDDAANAAIRELTKEKAGSAANSVRVAELFASNFIADGQAMREMFDIPSGKVVLFSELPGVMQDEVARQVGDVLPGEEVTIRQPEGGDERVIVEINAEPGEPKGVLPALREQLFVEFDGQRYQVDSMQDASEKWEAFRDETGVGSSEVSNLPIFDQTGKQVAYVSYNGKVWRGDDYVPNAEPVYVPIGQRDNSEKQPAAPVAESLAPVPSEPGNAGVASSQGGAAADAHWLHDEIVNLIHFKGRTQNRRALDKIVELLKRRAAGEDIRNGKVKSHVSGFKNEAALTEVLNRIVNRLEAEEKEAADGNETDQAQQGQPEAPQQDAPAGPKLEKLLKGTETAGTPSVKAVADDAELAKLILATAEKGSRMYGVEVANRLYGPNAEAARQTILEALTGAKVPKSRAGHKATMQALYDRFGVQPDAIVTMQRELDKKLNAAAGVGPAAAEPAAAGADEAAEPTVDDKGNPIRKVGDRVEITGGQFSGRHGEVTDVTKSRMVAIGLARGVKSEWTTYHYNVRSDNGTELYAGPDQMKTEESRPESVVMDPVVNGRAMEPESLHRSIGYDKQSAQNFRAKAHRARKSSAIAEHKRAAERSDASAVEKQAVWDEWAAKNPAEAEKIAPKPAAKTAATPQDAAAAAAPVDTAGAIKAAGLVVTKTTTKNNNPVWEVSGNTREHSGMLKAMGGRWYGPKKVWSFYNDDPSIAIAGKLGGSTAAPAPQIALFPNEVMLPENHYVYRKESSGGWTWRSGNGNPSPLGAATLIIPQLEAALAAKNPTIVGKPVADMNDGALERIADTETPAGEKARAELEARDAADEPDIGAMFDNAVDELFGDAPIVATPDPWKTVLIKAGTSVRIEDSDYTVRNDYTEGHRNDGEPVSLRTSGQVARVVDKPYEAVGYALRAAETMATIKAKIKNPTTPEGYAAALANPEILDEYQDEFDAYFQERLLAVRKEMQNLGWIKDDAKLVKNGREARFSFRQVGAGRNIVGMTINDVEDKLTLTPEKLALLADQTAGLTQARQDLDEMQAQHQKQGNYADDRLNGRIERQKKLIEEYKVAIHDLGMEDLAARLAADDKAAAAPVAGLYGGGPDARNSAPMESLDGFKPGDRVNVPNRTIGESTVELLFKRQLPGMDASSIARIVNGDGKRLDVITSELVKVGAGETAEAGVTKKIENAKRRLRETRNEIEQVSGGVSDANRKKTADLRAKESEIEREIRGLRQQALEQGADGQNDELDAEMRSYEGRSAAAPAFGVGDWVNVVDANGKMTGNGRYLGAALDGSGGGKVQLADNREIVAPYDRISGKATTDKAPAQAVTKKPVTPQVDAPAGSTPLGAAPRTAGEAGASAAKNAAMGLKDVAKGLNALFKPKPGTLGMAVFGAPFDEETYAAAKPLFAAGIAHFKQAGADLNEMVKALVKYLMSQSDEPMDRATLEAMKPYVVKFMGDVKDGKVVYDENQEVANNDPGTESQGSGTLAGMAPGEVGGAGSGGPGGSGTDAGGNASGAGNQGLDGPRGKTRRGGRNRPAATDSTGAGEEGNNGGSGTGPGTAGDGSRVPGSGGEGTDGALPRPVIPLTDFVIGEDVALGSGGQMTKYRDNVAAIKLLKTLETERRRATAAEQRVLARYVGWGGIPNAFRNGVTGEIKKDWAAEVAELESLLTPRELRAASASTRNAHYTAKEVVDFMWRAAARMGFDGGLVLEPSVGTGNFIGLMPEFLRGTTHVTGIELDSLTARIAGALYPRSNIVQSGLEKLPLPENRFDLAIGNPPFGAESLRFKFSPELNGASIHNQFFRASMDAVRPGGLQVMVVSRFLMDKEGTQDRIELAKQAKLLGAIRLPGSAFKGNALTEVVTDILFLQRRELAESGMIQEAIYEQGKKTPTNESDQAKTARLQRGALLAEAMEWVETGTVKDPAGGDPMVVNRYFINNPQMIAGVMNRTGSMRQQNDIDVKLAEGETLEQALTDRMRFLPNVATTVRSDEINERTKELHRFLGESMSLYATGAEEGAIRYEADGSLSHVIERVGENGEMALTKVTLNASTPWSPQLAMNLDGKWFRIITKLGADGKPVKKIVKGKVTKLNVYEREVFEKESDVPDGLRLGAKPFAVMKQLINIRDLMVEQINLETNSASVDAMEGNRKKLRDAYNAFVKDHGYISEKANAGIVAHMPDEGLLLSLESNFKREVTEAKAKRTGMKASPPTAQPAAILSRPVGIPPARAEHAETIGDALAIALSETGRLDLKRIQELRDIPMDAVEAELTEGDAPLAYPDPEVGFALVDKNAYLSGNVRRKLEAARAADLKKNVAALEAVQPEPWTSDQVTPKLGASWIPPQVFADFIDSLIGGKSRVTFARLTNTFQVTADLAGAAATAQWGTKRMPAPDLISALLNSRKIAVYDPADRDGGPYFNQVETDAANDKKREVLEAFDDWIFKDADRRRSLTQIFNDEFNVRVNRQHDGSHMKFPGKVPDDIIKFRRNQINAIWRGVVEDYVLYDHAVGAGKTFTGIARAMERRRMGLSKKPAVVVPNHLVKEWMIQTYRLYPGAKVLAAGKKDMEAKNRRRLFAKIATGDWDLVIIPHSSFGFINLSQETEERFLTSQLELANEALKEAWAEVDPESRFKPLGVKAAEALIQKIEKRMDDVRSKNRDRLINFEQMGIDDLTVDESHEFKNLMYSTNLTDVRGMGNASGSQKALDMYMKVKLLHEMKGGVAFMTGTPISNSAVEMYGIMRYLAPDLLNEMGLEHFDAFRMNFVDATAAFEPTDSGSGIKTVTRLGRQWSNMRSLMDSYYSIADVVTNDDIKQWYAEDNPGKEFPLPKVAGGERRAIGVPPTPTQLRLLLEVVAGFDGLPNIEDVRERNAERLRLMDRARKISLHAKALEPGVTDELGGKLDVAIGEILRVYKKWDVDKGTQLVFLDRGVPKSKGDNAIIKAYEEAVAAKDAASRAGDQAAFERATEKLDTFDVNEIAALRDAQTNPWNGYQHIKDGLVAQGIPENEIAFIQNYSSDEDKEALFNEVRDGTVRVLIGSTPRMGAGTNVQERLVALHHIDATWKPSDIEQREGRIIRQGNHLLEKYGDKFEVEIMAYVTERTVDAKLWALNSMKLKMINAIRHYDGAFEMEFDDEDSTSMAEISAIASGDPLTLERFKLTSEVETLYRQSRSFRRRIDAATDALDQARRTVENGPDDIRKLEETGLASEAIVERLMQDTDSRSLSMMGKVYRSAQDAQWDLAQEITRQKGDDEKAKISVEIGGKNYTSKSAAEEAVAEALGDAEPFVAEIHGQKVIRRSEYARGLREIIGEEFRNINEPIPAGSVYGVPVVLEANKGRYGSHYVSLHGTVAINDNGGKMGVSSERSLTPDKWKDGQPVPVTVMGLRALITQLEGDIVRRANNATSIEYAKQRIERAKSDIPSLEQTVTEKFRFADEYAQKEARLREVEAELAARVAASAQSAQVSLEPGWYRATDENGVKDENDRNLSADQIKELVDHGYKLQRARTIDVSKYHFRSFSRYGTPTIEVVENVSTVEIEGLPDHKFYAFKDGKEWRVIEDSTGVSLGRADTKKGAIDAANGAVQNNGADKVLARIAELKLTEQQMRDAVNAFRDKENKNTAESPVMDYNDPYESIETRPGTTERQKQVGLDALRDVERALFGRAADSVRGGRPSVLGLAINRDFREDGGTSFTGQKVSHPHDLAVMAQVLRDPRFETFRIFYTKGDAIAGQATFSSRLPGSVYLTEHFKERVADGMRRFGADGYWMMHNHPSGKSAPSRADMQLTADTAEVVPGFKGHVIIDHNEYTSISWPKDWGSPTSETIIDPTLGGMDMRANSAVPSEYLDARLGGPAEAVELAKRMQVKDGFIVVIGTDAALRVAVVLEIPEAAATPMSRGESMRNLAMARRLKSNTGVHALFAVVPGNYKDGRYNDLLRSRLFVDVIGANGSAAARGEVSGDVPLHTTSDATGNKAKKWFVEEPAYHGTPHEVDRFSTGKIGTGEGAQAYGWGLYFASSKAVAKHYKERLSEVSLTMNGKPISAAIWATGKTPEVVADAFASGRLVDALRYTKGADGKAIAAAAEKLAGEADKDARLFNDPAASRRETLIAVRLREFASAAKAGQMAVARGRLYSVELAPEPDEYLLWDKPLSKQSEKVAGLISLFAEEESLPVNYRNKVLQGDRTGQDFYNAATQKFGDQETASKLLSSYGIRGIKYLDGGSRYNSSEDWKVKAPEGMVHRFSSREEVDAYVKGRDGYEITEPQANYNYVIFDDADVAITGMESRGNFAYTGDYGLPDNNLDSALDAATLRDLRREAAGLESPERGTFLTVTEDGRAVATGQKGTRVPETFARFAEKHGLTFDARRIAPGQRGSSQGVGKPIGDTSVGSVPGEISSMSPAMPIEYRESGALYFGESGAFIDRTGKTRFSKAPTANFTGYTADEIRDGLIDSFGGKTIRQLEASGLLNVMENAEAFKALFPGVAVSNTAKAVFIKDRAYFFANRMRPQSARIELLHEIGEHYGLERLLGSNGYSNLIQSVNDMRANGDIHAARAWDFVATHYPEEAEGSRRFMHEVLAQLGQNADIQARPWWKELIEKVKRALVRMGFTGIIRVSDIQDMVLHSLKVAANEPDGGPRGGLRGSQIANTAMAKLGPDNAAWTEQRIDSLMGKYAYTQDDSKTKAFAAWIDPLDFLMMTSDGADYARIGREAGPLDVDRLRAEDQELFLEVNDIEAATIPVAGHEGRHRAMALMHAGIRQMPVVIYLRNGAIKSAAPVKRLFLNSQRFGPDSRGMGGGFVTGLVPISYEYRDELINQFGSGSVQFSQKGDWYYSALATAVPGMAKIADKAGMVSPEQAKTWLLARQKEGKFKADEFNWSGLGDYLDMLASKPVFEPGFGVIEEYRDEAGAWVQVDDLASYHRTRAAAEAAMADMPPARSDDGSEARLSIREWPELDLGKVGGKIAVADIERFVRENGVEVKDVMLGEVDDADVEAWWGDEGGANEETPFGELSFEEQAAAREQYRADVQMYDESGTGTKFDRHQLPGGENYRELLLTLPRAKPQTVQQGRDGGWMVQERDGSEPIYGDTREQAMARYEQSRPSGTGSNFTSSHFDQPNILAHVRFNERTDASGKRVLFIEEIQSDWAQKGRKHGFAQSAGILTTIRQRGDSYVVFDEAGVERGSATSMRGAEELQRNLANNRTGVPTAPFVTDTKAWTGLALKRMIAYAAENGFDSIAWTTGEQQAERYDLSKQVSRVQISRPQDGSYAVYAYKQNTDTVPVIQTRVNSKDELADLLGKEFAERVAKQVVGTKRDYTGLDLKVGGEGMKGYYDQIVPQVAKKLGAEIGAVVIETEPMRDEGPDVDTPISEDGLVPRQQPGFAITDAMREKALAGLPLFSKRSNALRWDGRNFIGGDVSLIKTAEIESATVFSVLDASGQPIGAVSLYVLDGKITGLTDIQAFDKKRGTGSRIVDSILDSTDGNVYIENMIPKAVGFWVRMGVQLDEGYSKTWNHGNGFLSAEGRRQAIESGRTEASAGIAREDGTRGVGSTQAEVPNLDLDSPLESRGNYLDTDGVADTLSNFPRDRATAAGRSPDRWFKPVLDGVLSSFKGSSNFGALDRSIHTQLHKAQKNRYFGETFKRVQHFMEDASRAALRPAELAPTVLPRIDAAENIAGALKALLKGKEASADIDAAFGAALAGTLDDKVFKTAEDASLTPEQFSVYREIRDAADASLDELSAAEVWGIARTLYLNAAGKLTQRGLRMKKALLAEPGQARPILLDPLIADLEDARLRFGQLAEVAREKAPFVTGGTIDALRAAMASGLGNQEQNGAIARALEAAEQVKALDDTVEKVAQMLNRRDQLQREGYVPLMRFGQHYLTVSLVDPISGEVELDENGEKVTEYFGLFESAAERDKAAKALRELYPDDSGADFDTGTLSEEEWQRYKGVSPETVALFAGKLGIGNDEVFQEWYRLAASNRSTLKRLIHRKGTPGFSEDGARVMASFLTSNGRRASMLYHMADIQESIDDFPRQQGAEKDEAIRMVEYIQNQDEEAATPRALLFMHFLGGTVSNFLINATQPAMVTLPYVAQFVGMPRATALMKEAYRIRNKPEAMSQELRDALARADQEGKVGAQEIHHLWQETARPLANSLGRFGDAATYRAHAFMSLWGMPFAIAEHMNRQVTFITAYNAAKEKGSTADQAYSKAIQAIDETQFIYGKNNRPNWARGNIGAVIFTFKLFSLSYTELLVRMLRQNPESRKAALYMLGMLILASGLQGLPGSDDLDDLIDTIGQSFGYNVNSRLAKRKWLEGMAGKEVANFAMHGLSALTPFDVSARMSLGNLIPGTGLFKASNSRKEADLLEIVGPAGGLAMSYINTWDAVATGNWSRAATEWMPKALKDAVRGGEMLVTGEALDQRGRKVVDVNPLEAVIKAAGFNPQAIAEIGRNTRDVQQKIAFARRTENLIAEHWARGIVDGKADDVRAAKESINKWNETNPETPISVKYSAVARRAAAMRANKSERFIKAATKEMRDYAAEAIE